jgi:hypothetical protein
MPEQSRNILGIIAVMLAIAAGLAAIGLAVLYRFLGNL